MVTKKETVTGIVKKKTKFYRSIILILLIGLIISGVASVLQDSFNSRIYNNKNVLYCELANLNAEAANEMLPYFWMYADESIETVAEVNKTASRLLELSMAGKKDLEMPELDCPIEKCDSSFSPPEDRLVCEMIKELKYDR